jgi:formate hydrogenlyase subunit 4
MTAALGEALVPLAQLLALILAAPLFAGVLHWIEDRLAARTGRTPLEPYWRLFKLVRKDEIRPAGSSLVYDLAPAGALAATVAAAGLVPAITATAPLGAAGGAVAFCGLLALARFATAIAAIDSGNPLAVLAVGQERRAASLSEPALLLALVALALVSGTAEIGDMVAAAPHAAPPIGRLLALCALVTAVLADGHRPRAAASDLFDAASAQVEASGLRLAILELTLDLRRLALFVLAVNLIVPAGIAAPAWGSGLFVAAVLLAIKLAGAALLCATIGSARSSYLRSSTVLGAALVLGTLAILFAALAAPELA